MKNQSIAKVDPKGRVLIPVHLRNQLGIEEGTEMIIVPDGDKPQMKIFPLVKNKTAEIRLVLRNSPGSLASVANILTSHQLDVILSESKRIGTDITEWKIIVDTSNGKQNVESLKDIVSNIDTVMSMDIVKR